MKTIIYYHNYVGDYQEKKESDYIDYKRGDKIIFKSIKYIVMSTSYDETKNEKRVNVYKTND